MAGGFSTAYGVDAGSGRLVLARYARRGLPPRILDVPAGTAEAVAAMQAAVAEVEPGRAVLACSAPAPQTFIRRLRAPFASTAKAAKVWPALLDVELPFPVESARCVFDVPRIVAGAAVCTAAAIRNQDLDAALAACRAAGCDPTHVDVEALALWDQQGVEMPPVRPDVCRVLLWLGSDHVAIVRGRGVDFLGANVLRASPLADDPASRQAFAALWSARVPPILSAHLAETESQEIDLWWAGPGTADEDLMARLRTGLALAGTVRHELHRQPASFLARSLARRALGATGVNFLEGDRMHPAILRTRVKTQRRNYVSMAAAALLVLGLNAAETVRRGRVLEDWQARLADAARAIAGNTVVPGQEALMVERALPLRDEAMQAFRTALDPVGLEGRLAGTIEEAGELGLEVTHLALSAAAVAIEGTAPAIQAVETYAERLREQGWSVQTESPGLTAEGRPRFILKGTAGHGG